MWSYNPADKLGSNPLGGYVGLLTADQATTVQTAAPLTNFTFPIKQGHTWAMRARVLTLGVSGGGKFTVSGPASPTLLKIVTKGPTTGITAYSTDTVTALDTVSGAYNTSAVTAFVEIDIIITASVDGTVVLNFENVTSTNSFVAKAGSYFTAQRLS